MFRKMSGLLGGGGARAQRIAVVDVGSNSVRMVVFLAETRIPAVLFNEKALCGLGEELELTGRLSPDGRRLALAALTRFSALADEMRADALMAIGTAAVRDAADGPDFVAEVARTTGIEINVATGIDEARLAAQGVLLGEPDACGLAADLGGASLELVGVDARAEGPVGAGVTTPLGALRVLTQIEADGRSKTTARIDATLDEALGALAGAQEAPPSLYALGGSFRAFAGAWMQLSGYPLRVLQGYSLPLEEAVSGAERIAKTKPADLRQISGVSERRARVTPAACLVLSRLLRKVRPERLVVSAFGLREGAYWERLTAELKRADPLLDASAQIERLQARSPGFGRELFGWLRPALSDLDATEARLAEAACLLADAGWRTHPDYRAVTVLELVTRNAFGGVDHVGRAFIAAALLHRYKGGRKAARIEPALALASSTNIQRAEALGRGMRLGVALAGAAPGVLPKIDLQRDATMLTLGVRAGASLLGGEEVARRLDAFASALGLEARLIET